jgi:hypothetical protein
MKSACYISSFRNLTITEGIRGHFELMPGVNITNDPAVMARFLTPEFANAIGVIESDYLHHASNLVFGEFNGDSMPDMPPDRFCLARLVFIDMLLKNAWLIKDHAMECDALFLRVKTSIGATWTKNFLAMRPTFADGGVNKEVKLSISELTDWSRIMDIVESYLSDTGSSSFHFTLNEGYCRSGRAMQFVSAARKTPDLALKIANYCNAFEVLFTTESGESSSTVPDNVALFLEEKNYNRRTVLETIKNTYWIRSLLLCGGTLEPHHIAELPALSMRCDQYLRGILNEIFKSKKEIVHSTRAS